MITDFKDIRGQEHAKRALEVAILGGHKILLISHPGQGASSLKTAADIISGYAWDDREGFGAEVVISKPCPCGFYGHGMKACICSVEEVRAFEATLPQDIDICVELGVVGFEEITDSRPGEVSERVIERLKKALVASQKRGPLNAALDNEEVAKYCKLDGASLSLLKAAYRQLVLSPKQYTAILRVARSIADLAGEVDIKASHVAEAIQYRRRTV